METKSRTALFLFFGIFVLSWSSILIRWMGDLNPMIIAFYRLILSALVIAPFAGFRRKQIHLPKLASSKTKMLFAGLFLALHFYTWITSLQLTTVGNSIFLESTHPLFGWLLSLFFLKESGGRRLLVSFVLGVVGMYLIVSVDLAGNSRALAGDLLAIFSALCLAAYLLMARMMTGHIPLLPYLVWIYGLAAFFMLLPLAGKGIPFWRISAMNWFLLFLLALGPNLIGHSLLNWASRRIPIYKVNLAMLGEAVLATVYAGLLLNEIPQKSFFAGAVLILISIGFAFWEREEANISEA